jgi:hypothetical protein
MQIYESWENKMVWYFLLMEESIVVKKSLFLHQMVLLGCWKGHPHPLNCEWILSSLCFCPWISGGFSALHSCSLPLLLKIFIEMPVNLSLVPNATVLRLYLHFFTSFHPPDFCLLIQFHKPQKILSDSSLMTPFKQFLKVKLQV